MTSRSKFRILFAEDLPSDSELAVMELRKEGLVFDYIVVDTKSDFIRSLNEFRPDIIISDYLMPSYNGLQALSDAKEFDPLIPFILYTGSVNEEIAVQCMKAGADDYIIKEHMTRLPFAVKEALEQYRIQIEKRAATLLLQESEEKIQSIFSAAPIGIGLSVNRVMIEINDSFSSITGYARRELIGKSSEFLYLSKEEFELVGREYFRQIKEHGSGSVETRLRCKDGKIIDVFLSFAPLDNTDLSRGITFTILDISRRKKAESELISSFSLLNASLESTADGILIADGKGGIVKWNQKFAVM
ncbi:MAG: hypothetical protein C0408_10245, partial [Odoribacter sp.]|nr:hypothetical protein [Odoribacter sp.]